MNEEKYYTPELEDLFVGYECEQIKLDFSRYIDLFLPEGATKEEYRKAWDNLYNSDKFESDRFVFTEGDLSNYFLYREVHIRTPLLTKEQIIAEGWEEKEGRAPARYYEDGSFYYAKLSNYPYSQHLLIGHYKPSGEDVWSLSSQRIIFDGECKSINEFRKICKYLNIKYDSSLSQS